MAEPEKASVKPVEDIISKKKPVANSELAAIGNTLNSKQNKVDQTEQDPDLKIKTKISEIPEELIAETSSKENITGDISDAELDDFLAEATEKINMERSARSVSEKIDANNLLFDVEMELEQSFREKVFDVLKEGFLKAKTSVANRNN